MVPVYFIVEIASILWVKIRISGNSTDLREEKKRPLVTHVIFAISTGVGLALDVTLDTSFSFGNWLIGLSAALNVTSDCLIVISTSCLSLKQAAAYWYTESIYKARVSYRQHLMKTFMLWTEWHKWIQCLYIFRSLLWCVWPMGMAYGFSSGGRNGPVVEGSQERHFYHWKAWGCRHGNRTAVN